MNKNIYPDWAEKFHTPGTAIKKINNSYYLYSVTSHFDSNKKYPVSEQHYIGRIDEHAGLIKKEKITFDLTKDKIYLLSDLFDLSDIKAADLNKLKCIPVIKAARGKYTPGVINRKTVNLIEKYFKYDEGVISGRL